MSISQHIAGIRSRTTHRISTPVFTSPGQLSGIQDIELDFNNERLEQLKVLDKLEQQWADLTLNLDATLNHLLDCSNKVTESSTACSSSLKGSVDATCDKIDEELKALYHLMTKCDELTTKLSVASSFRDEIKTLRKSVETLEHFITNAPSKLSSAPST